MPTPLPIRLDRTATVPLPVQIAAAVRDLLLTGTLGPGERLPSTRALAADLGVSRATVETAWDQLRAEGWIRSRHGAGTLTSTGTARPRSVDVPAPPSRGRTPASRAPEPVPMDAGTPWRAEPAPRQVAAGWRRAWRRVADETPPRGYDDPHGVLALRTEVAARLTRTRGVDVGPDDVRITHGTTSGLGHVLAALPRTPVGIEDPGYRAAVATVLATGREVRDLPIPGTRLPSPAEAGVPVVPGAPRWDLAGLSAVYVTPAHQHPLGRVMPAEERVALLEEAARHDCLVVEDDYDSELRYDVAPVPALAAMAPDGVALLSTASKAVMPSLRLGWMVVPEHLRAPVDAFRALTHDTPPWAVQVAFAELLAEGHVDAMVRAARRTYAERAPRVVAALQPYARLAGPVAGMYSTWLLEEERAVAARDAALRAGFRVNLLSTYARSSGLTGLVVGFGGADDEELDRALAVLARTLS